jgi:hypothetical protein
MASAYNFLGRIFCPLGKKPGYPLQSSGFCFAKSARISASIPCAEPTAFLRFAQVYFV